MNLSSTCGAHCIQNDMNSITQSDKLNRNTGDISKSVWKMLRELREAANEHIEIESIDKEQWTGYFEYSYYPNTTTPNIVLDKGEETPIIITGEEVETAEKKPNQNQMQNSLNMKETH